MVLGVACTGIACILYFRLIANVGAARALAVTYLGADVRHFPGRDLAA